MDRDLIYDVGMNVGQDTGFYLKKGFRVVAVEANTALCAAAEAKFANELRSGQLVIVNKAVAPRAGPVTFYVHPGKSEWGTMSPAFAARNRRLGVCNHEVVMEGVPFASILARHGIPYYLKVDIEGADLLCFEALRDVASRPKYVSLETSKTSFGDLIGELGMLWSLGYRRFQIVRQGGIQQVPPFPSREKGYADRIERGGSGLFGEELPGPWIEMETVLARYRAIFRRYRLVGDDPKIRSKRVRFWLRKFGYSAGWHDLHATFADE